VRHDNDTVTEIPKYVFVITVWQNIKYSSTR